MYSSLSRLTLDKKPDQSAYPNQSTNSLWKGARDTKSTHKSNMERAYQDWSSIETKKSMYLKE